MEFNMEARFILETVREGKVVLCFKHAVQAANRGEHPEIEVSNDFDTIDCRACYKERHKIT